MNSSWAMYCLIVTESTVSPGEKRDMIHATLAIPNTEIYWFWKDDIYGRAQRMNVLKVVR